MDILASALLMLSLRPRLMLTPTFCMEVMDMDILDTLDTMVDTPMPTTDYTMASVLLMLSLRPRLMLILTFSMEDMDILDMLDITDILMPMDMLTLASALLMPSPRLMLTPTFSMEDTDMDTLDMLATMDIPMVDMPTWDKLQSPKPYPATENGQNNHQCLLLQ